MSSSILFAGLMSIGSPVGVLLGMAFTDQVERKWGIVVFTLLAALLGAGYAFAQGPVAIVTMGFLLVMTIYLMGTLA